MFHFYQTMNRQVNQRGLSKLRKEHRGFDHFYKMLKALVYVPADQIPAAYEVVVATLDPYLEVGINY